MFFRFLTSGAWRLIDLIMGCNMETLERSNSALIDVFLIRLLTVIMYCVTVSILHLVCNRTIYYAERRFLGRTVYLVLLYIVIMLCVHFLYFFLSERAGTSIGKKIAWYAPAYGKAENWQAALVALCKTGACVLYIATVPYFLITGNMPYDKVRRGSMGAINQGESNA